MNRAGIAAIAAIGLVLAAMPVSLDLAIPLAARAQTEPAAAISAIQTPPPVPGVDYTVAEPGKAPPLAGEITAATPIPPVIPAGAAKIGPDASGSLTTNLGGSDVAVSNVGGSYEVDGPKRKAKKHARMTPTP